MLCTNQRNLYFVFGCLLSISTSVSATPPPWQGPYAGIYLGGGFGSNHAATNAGLVTNTSYFTTVEDINAVQNAGTWWKEPSAVTIGLRAGHDWVWKQMIYGAALDYSSLSLNSSHQESSTYPNNADQYSVYTSMSTNWLFTLRARLGYQKTLNVPSLLYLTGGMAMTKLKTSNSFSDSASLVGTGGNESFQNQIGWTAGAGIEVATFRRVSVNIEYLYIVIPSIKTKGSIANTQAGFGIPEQSLTSPLSTTANFHANIFRIGLNYRFDE